MTDLGGKCLLFGVVGSITKRNQGGLVILGRLGLGRPFGDPFEVSPCCQLP